MDLIANRSLYRFVPLLSRLVNRFLGGNFRFQALPHLFDVWADGMDLVIFEEFAAGTEALHLVELSERASLIQSPDYQKRFRREWEGLFSPRVYHRNLKHTEIIDCPDKSMVGQSFAQLAPQHGRDALAVFLNLVASYGPELRWHSAVANDRRAPLEQIVAHPDVLIGFSDAGAHLRNMAFYNFPLRLIKLARDAQKRGAGFMTIERAIHRVTGELGDWFGLPIGRLTPGRQADIVAVRPEALDSALDETHEEAMPGFNACVAWLDETKKL